MRSVLLVVPCLSMALVACSSAPSSSTVSASAPAPRLMQYVGGYEGTGAVTTLTLHVDGTFEVTAQGATSHGTFTMADAATDHVDATLTSDDGHASNATLRTLYPSDGGPPRVTADLSGALATTTLGAPWLGGHEEMCTASGGQWTDDDPDPKTGLYCRCATTELYLPSRGGCVTPARGGDPDRRPLDSRTREAAGRYAGEGTITALSLEDDGTFDATVAGHADHGTWWGDGAPGAFALVSASRSFWATSNGDTVNVSTGAAGEALQRSR